MPDRPTFELGLVMAGAVSAGAYTAGVLDFLLEALDAIEDVRAGRDIGYLRPRDTKGKPIFKGENPVFDPPHGFRLKALSGTSAGAMVTAILTTILGTRIPPVGPARQWTDTAPTGNPLYDCWVQQIHWDKLLGTDDLAGDAPVRSLLNARHLDEIVAGGLAYAQREDYPRPYAGPRLPIYLCVGNLRGVRYSLGLSVDAGVNEYQMSMHADWLGFCFDRNPEASLAGMRSLAPGQASDHWATLGAAALASGAFPVGLAARPLMRRFSDYETRDYYDPSILLSPERRRTRDGQYMVPADSPASWESRAGAFRHLDPLDHATDFPGCEYRFVNVDGGVFNNEPLELCRVAVARDDWDHPDAEIRRNPRSPLAANRGVLLIDPFPNLFEFDPDYHVARQSQLLNILKSLVGAVMAQSRFKPDELALAKDPDVASRYAIMPIRYGAGDAIEKYAIACGSLGGFGGFLSKAFRHHDFMLGRRNCQRFLSHHFVLPADPAKNLVNLLFAAWAGVEADKRTPFEVRSETRIDNTVTADVVHLPIVPLIGKLASPDYTAMPPWPVWPSDLQMDALRTAILDRADALKNSLIAQYQPDWVLRQGINSLWWLNKDKWVQRFAIAPLLDDLHKHGLTG